MEFCIKKINVFIKNDTQKSNKEIQEKLDDIFVFESSGVMIYLNVVDLRNKNNYILFSRRMANELNLKDRVMYLNSYGVDVQCSNIGYKIINTKLNIGDVPIIELKNNGAINNEVKVHTENGIEIHEIVNNDGEKIILSDELKQKTIEISLLVEEKNI